MNFPKPPWDEATIRRYFTQAELAPGYAKMLGFEFVDVDVAAMTFECTFNPGPELCSPAGTIQGGFITAMLDDTMSLSAISTLGFDGVVPTLEMKTSFLAPVQAGFVRAKGQVLKKGRKTFFTEGRLWDRDGQLLAHATATCIHRPHDKVKASRARHTRGESNRSNE